MPPNTSRTRIRNPPQVRVGGLRALNSGIRAGGLSGTAGADLSRRLKEAAEFVAVIARSNAAEFSTRVPGTVKVMGGRSGVIIRAGGPNGPAAYTAETAARHPLFGLPNAPWYQGPSTRSCGRRATRERPQQC